MQAINYTITLWFIKTTAEHLGGATQNMSTLTDRINYH